MSYILLPLNCQYTSKDKQYHFILAYRHKNGRLNQAIVLKGFRRKATLSDLCGREGIKPGVFYVWTKELSGDVGD